MGVADASGLQGCPESDWLREPVPALRIIDDDLWTAAQARQAALAGQPRGYNRKPKRLLSGLMKCATCGLGMTLNGQKFACSAARERGTCTNAKIIAAKTIEARVLDGIREKLLTPQAMADAVESLRQANEARRQTTLSVRAPMTKELASIERQLERAQLMCMEGVMEIEDLKTRSIPLKARRSELQALLAEVDQQSIVSLHPSAAQAYAQLASRLHEALEDDDGEEVRAEIRKLVDRRDFYLLEGLGRFDLQVHGSLGVLLGLSEGQTAESPTAFGGGAFWCVWVRE